MTTVYAIIFEHGGLHGFYADGPGEDGNARERVHEKARRWGAIVAEWPAAADYRDLTGGKSESPRFAPPSPPRPVEPQPEPVEPTPEQESPIPDRRTDSPPLSKR